MKTGTLAAAIAAAPINEVVSALRNHPDFLAVKVWTREDCRDFAESYLEAEAPDASDAEFGSRLDAIADRMMENRYSSTLDPLRDISEGEADAMRDFARECDPETDRD